MKDPQKCGGGRPWGYRGATPGDVVVVGDAKEASDTSGELHTRIAFWEGIEPSTRGFQFEIADSPEEAKFR